MQLIDFTLFSTRSAFKTVGPSGPGCTTARSRCPCRTTPHARG